MALMDASPQEEQRKVWSPPFSNQTAGAARPRPMTPAGVRLNAVANAASGEAGWAAPGQMVVLHGENFAPGSPEKTNGREGPGTDPDVRVLFDGIPAPILSLSPAQILAVVPYALSDRDWVSVVVESYGELSAPVLVMMVDANPALFTVNGRGRGQAVAENGDGNSNGVSSPVLPGGFLTLFGTGEGMPDREAGPQDGVVPAESWLLPQPKLPIRVFIGEEEAEVVYAGAMPGGAFGKLQLVLQVPRTLKAGCHEVRVHAGRFLSQSGVTVIVG